MGSLPPVSSSGFSKPRPQEGGTVWSVGALIIAVIGSARMWTLAQGALERFAYSSDCAPSASQVQVDWVQVGVVLASGLLALTLAEFGSRRAGNRWVSMIASVIGVSLVIGGVLLALSLVAPPLPCNS